MEFVLKKNVPFLDIVIDPSPGASTKSGVRDILANVRPEWKPENTAIKVNSEYIVHVCRLRDLKFILGREFLGFRR